MTPQEMWQMAKQHDVTMSGRLTGEKTWRRVIDLDGDRVTVSYWTLPSEIGNQKTFTLADFSEFDLG